MKRNLRTICLLSITSLLGVSVLSGCGGGGSNDGLVVHFWHTTGDAVEDGLEKKANAFARLVEENEGVKVRIELEYQGGYDDILTKIRNGINTGNSPTIAIAYPDHVAEYMSRESTPGSFVVNLDNYVNDEEIGFGKQTWLSDDPTLGASDFVQGFYTEGQQYIREGTYSLPFMKSTEVLFYNADYMPTLFNIYNPEIRGEQIDEFLSDMTWAEFMDLARVAKENASSIFSTVPEDFVPILYDSDSNLFITQAIQSGQKFVDMDNGQGAVSFNTPEVKALVQDLKTNYDAGLIATKGTKGQYSSNYFKEEKALFTIGSSGGTGYNLPSGGAFEVGMAKVPYLNNNPLYVTQGPTLTLLNNISLSAAQNEQLVKYGWMFMKYITNTQENVDMCLSSMGYVPVRSSSYLTEDFQEYMKEGEYMAMSANVVINDIQGKYIVTPVFKGTSVARDEVGGIITQVLLGAKTVDEAFADAVNQTLLGMSSTN